MGGHGDAAVGVVVDVFAGALSTMRLGWKAPVNGNGGLYSSVTGSLASWPD
jgi:hypothetical protein